MELSDSSLQTRSHQRGICQNCSFFFWLGIFVGIVAFLITVITADLAEILAMLPATLIVFLFPYWGCICS